MTSTETKMNEKCFCRKVVSFDLIWVFFMPFLYNGVYSTELNSSTPLPVFHILSAQTIIKILQKYFKNLKQPFKKKYFWKSEKVKKWKSEKSEKVFESAARFKIQRSSDPKKCYFHFHSPLNSFFTNFDVTNRKH